jgi:glycosyltransferase involved in cell wall biosynthesis
MRKTLVSIVTIAFNSDTTIRDTIESVLNQTYTNIEYFIIDGLSTDKTVDIANSYLNKFKEKSIKYTVISESDSGIYNAMNKGIKLATGELIGIINSDDLYELDAIQKAVTLFEKTKFDMMFANLRIIKSSGNVIKKARMRRYITTRDWNFPSMFVAKKVYDRIQFKEQSIYDDFDLYLRIKEGGYKIEILDEVIANFRFGGVSTEKDFRKMIERINIRYQVYINNGYSKFYLIECITTEFAKYLMA